MRIFLFLLSLLSFVSAHAVQPDSLRNKSFDELKEQTKILLKQNDSLQAKRYFKAYINKANQTNNRQQVVNIYRSMAIWQEKPEKGLIYADSAIAFAHATGNEELIGNAYYTKGVVYYSGNDWKNALENYLQADQYISKTDNEYLQHKIKYCIGSAKYVLGYYQEALELKEKCVEYFSSVDSRNHNRGYLNSLHSAGLCYHRMGNYSKASEINRLGEQQARQMKEPITEHHFIHSEGINQYYLGDHQKSIALLQSVLPVFINKNDLTKQNLTYFFLGKNYIDLGKDKEAIQYFEKVDSLFAQTGYLRDDMVQSYAFLIENAGKQQDLAKELYYTNRLIKADQFVNSQYKDVVVRLHKDYDVRKLQESKTRIEKLLGQKTTNNRWLLGLLSVAFGGIITFMLRYLYYKKKFSRLYKDFMSLQESNKVKALQEQLQKETSAQKARISDRTLKRLFKDLEQFEKNKGFTKENLTLTSLAKSMKTNSKYLAEAIQYYKSTDFIHYINDLRIAYLMDLIKIKMYRDYTIEALGKEIGFSSAKGFNSFFEKYTQMKFSSFLKKYNEDTRQTDNRKAAYAEEALESV